MNNALNQIINRHKSLGGESYIEVIAFDDLKQNKKVEQEFYEINKTDISTIEEKIKEFNKGTYGVYINVNPITMKLRNKDTVKKYVYCFIDLDDATLDHGKIVETFLLNNKFTYDYLGQSGSGFHFLIPILLENKDQPKIKGFLQYLKNNVCDKVDISTNDPSRIFRAPLSIHNKKEPFNLKTLNLYESTKDEIKKNTSNLSLFQEDNKKAILDIKYLSSIDREDIFFSELLNNTENWKDIFEMLNEHDKKPNLGIGSNQIFNKNLAIFISKNDCYLEKAILFMKSWNNAYVTYERFKYFYDKVRNGTLRKENNVDFENNVNYYELSKWATDYNLVLFKVGLLKQLQTSFLDEMEFYYLEDEKSEFQYLIYYSTKNYFIQKPQLGVLDIIYYEAKEKGIDLIKEWKINTKNEKGQELSHINLIKRIRNTILTKLDKENRIRKIFNINYAPIEDKFLYYDNKTYFNIYVKTNYWDYYIERQEYFFPKIKDLIMNLCGNDENNYIWFNMWLAWQIRNPTFKLPTAVIFQGQQGTGKGVFKTHILDNLFGSNVQEINQTHLESSFNEYLMGKQIIIANEVIHNENKALLPNVLKNLVTDPEITISRKFKKEITGKNYTHWIFCTNNDNPLKIDEDDRRYSVFYSTKLMGSEDNANKFVKQLQSNLDAELKEYISYLKSIEIIESQIRKPIMTEAKAEIIELNKDSINRFIDYFNQFPNLETMATTLNNNKFIYNEKENMGIKYINTDLIYLIYEAYCDKFKERGIFNKQTFGKKLSNKKIKSESLYFKESNGSLRVYNLNDLQKVRINK